MGVEDGKMEETGKAVDYFNKPVPEQITGNDVDVKLQCKGCGLPCNEMIHFVKGETVDLTSILRECNSPDEKWQVQDTQTSIKGDPHARA